MEQVNTSKSQSRLAWLGLCVFVAILLFVPVLSARGIGSRKLIVHFAEGPTDAALIRVATILRKHAESLLTDPPQPEIEWQTVADEKDGIEIRLTYVTITTSSFLWDYGTKRIPYEDVLAVEYRGLNEQTRYRLVPFDDLAKFGTIEMTISREPPSDAEAWKPESSGR